MCGRYTLTEIDMLYDYYGIEAEPDNRLVPNFNVAPTQIMPVVREQNGVRRLELMRWGIPRFIGPGKVKDVFNTRADKAFWSWKNLTMQQRVLVPATGYYEWKPARGGKQPYYIHPRATELCSFAGIWSEWKQDDGSVMNTYSIITTEPNEEMLEIHDRMPVILHQADEHAWLSHDNDNDRDTLETLLVPFDDGALESYEVSRDVNSAKINTEMLMYPLVEE